MKQRFGTVPIMNYDAGWMDERGFLHLRVSEQADKPHEVIFDLCGGQIDEMEDLLRQLRAASGPSIKKLAKRRPALKA